MQLAYHGRLVLLLDRWNELDPASRTRATRDLKALRRDFPLLRIVIGTRRNMLPISGPVVEIQPLSEDQQLELARCLRGKDGEALVDQAWRTPGARELIAIPLYLSALLGSTPGAAFPQTKEEVLRLFVTQHEQAPEKAEILHKELFGFHTELLIGLAVEANRTANTVISDTNARRAVAETEAQLVANGQLVFAPQPTTVLDVLVSGHILLRSSSGAGGISFQHQQFQEWYASFEVERLMQEAAQGNPDGQKRLRADVLNRVPWEESILFACERLSREGADGAQTVAAAILDALAIDPMLAAEMIYRAAPEAWLQIKDTNVAFADRWHKPGQVDRAVRFMITSGRPEFAPHIWPLVSSLDNQIYLSALRAARRFRPSVLGNDAAARLGALPEDVRSHVVAEIASNSGFDGMELAASIAKTDLSPEVVVEILQSLQFRCADRHVGEILEAAPDAVWQLVASKGYPDKLVDPSLNAHLAELRRAEIIRQTDPIQVIYNLTGQKIGEAASGERVAQLIQSADFPMRSEHAGGAIQRAFDVYPQYVANALLHRMAAGLELPYRADEFLKDVPSVEDGPIVAAALDSATPEGGGYIAFTVLGPKTVGRIIDQLFALDDEFRVKGTELGEPARKEYHRLMGAIVASRQASFVAALLERAASDQPTRVRLMADLLARHSKGFDKEPLVVSEDMRDRLAAVLGRWIELMLTSPEANRHEFSDVARAAERLAQPEHVRGLQQMLERDLGDWARAREEHLKSPRHGPLTPDVTHSYTLQYQRAFFAIGGAEVIALMKDYLPDLRGIGSA